MTTSKQNELLSAYAVIGDDVLKRERVMERLRTRLEALGDIAFNSDVFSGETCTGDEVVSACNTLPFASEKRLVHVSAIDALGKADADALVTYLDAPSPTTVLVLEGEKLAKNTRLYKAVQAQGKQAIIECTLSKAYELPEQVCTLAASHGIVLDKAAATHLIERAGDNTLHLDSELKRLALQFGEGARLNAQTIDEAVVRTNAAKPWEFVNAFSARDVVGCMRTLQLLEDTSPYALIVMCCNRIRELICAQSLELRRDGTSLASALKLPDWRVKNYASWARKFAPGKLEQALISARDAERAMKSSSNADEIFRDWVLGVIAPTN